MKPRALILRTAGTNCDAEAAYAFELAGASAERVHINRILERRAMLNDYQLLAIPGGFSYGDDISAGKILANQITHHLRDVLRNFIDAGKPVIGICNGFQALVKTDLLPGPLAGHAGQTATLTDNDSGRFIDRWIHLSVRSRKCIWTAGLSALELPIAHGEGKFVLVDDAVRQSLWDNDQVALTYCRPDGSSAEGKSPENPNGSVDDIAGICDSTGLVLGLMPHPERHVSWLQRPDWTHRKKMPQIGAGATLFFNAVHHVCQTAGAGV